MVEVKAYKCSWCHRCFLRKCNAVQHEDGCNRNPKKRACHTCTHDVCKETEHDFPGISGTRKEHYCLHFDVPMYDKPWLKECDINNCCGVGPDQPVPFTCEHYQTKPELIKHTHPRSGAGESKGAKQ